MFYISKLWSRTTKQAFVRAFQARTSEKAIALRAPAKPIAEQFRLLIITQFFPPDYAATGQLIQELAEQLGNNNVRVNIFTGQPGYAFKQKQAPVVEVQNNVTVQRSRIRQFWGKRIRGKTLNGIIFTLKSAKYLLTNARKNDAVVLTTAPPFLSIVGYVANLLFKLDYICLIYDLYPDAAVELGVVSRHHAIAKLWHKINAIVWQRSKKIVVLSETMKQRIVARHPGIASKITVIHNWADPSWIEPLDKKNNWFACQQEIDREFTVLYSGNLGYCHDLDTIINTAKSLKDRPIKFVFIGAGAKYRIGREIAAESNLNNCKFLPYQDKANLPYSLTACDLSLVSIAPGFEGVIAPSKVYGIMAAGKAIAAICQPDSYLRQLITNAKCGAAFDNNDSDNLARFILALAADLQLATSMGTAGRQYMKNHFTPQIIARQYCEVLGIDLETQNQNTVGDRVLFATTEVSL